MKIRKTVRIRGFDVSKHITEAVQGDGDWTENATDHTLPDYRVIKSKSRHPPVKYFLVRADDCELSLANVLHADKQTSLTIDEYNRSVDLLVAQFLKPLARKSRLKVKVSHEDYRLEDQMGPTAVRWMKAICAEHTRGQVDDRSVFALAKALTATRRPVHFAELSRWLREDQRWTENSASELAEKLHLLVDFQRWLRS